MTDRGASTGQVVAGFARVAWRALAVMLAVALALEATLRFRGFEPQDLYRVGFSPSVIDRWTESAMRPSVLVNEYAVTNFFGLHEDREVNLAKTPGVRRVAVMGSSVVWGLGSPLDQTISRSMERRLVQAGCPAEVLNFGNQGFTMLNTAAYLQAKMHQFHPDAVVVVMDLQMGLPRFPRPNPEADEQNLVRRLGPIERTWKRATEYSVLFRALDDVEWSRSLFAGRLPFRTEPARRGEASGAAPEPADAGRKALEDALERVASLALVALEPLKVAQFGAVTLKPASPVPAAQPERTTQEYEQRRERELGALVAAASTFAREMQLPLYFTTPYGPYFRATEAQLARFSLHILAEALPLYGSPAAAVRREAELQADVIARAASRHGARVIDMQAASREATISSAEFSVDGIHFTDVGNRRVAGVIAARLQRDGLCGAAGLQG